MTTNNNDRYEPDVQSLVRRLEKTDFSVESVKRASLRQQLIDQAAQTLPTGMTLPQQHSARFSPVYTLAGLAAVVIMLLMVVIAAPPAMSVTTIQATATPTPTAPTPAADAAIPQIYFTLQTTRENAPFDLYAPAYLPDGYEFQSVRINHDEPQQIRQIYYESQAWLSAVFDGDPYSTDVDYLYIVQQAAGEFPTAGEGTPIPANTIVQPPSGVAGSSATYLNPVQDENGDLIFNAVGQGMINERPVTYLTRRTRQFIFQIWSYHLEGDALTKIADGLVNLNEIARNSPNFSMDGNPAPGVSFDPDAPGACPAQYRPNFELTFDGWGNPLRFGGYSLGESFSTTHSGVDLVTQSGKAVSAAREGAVVFAGESTQGYGLAVMIAHRDFYSLYAHLSVISVHCGDVVARGQALGATGMTGNTTEPHLHFEIWDAEGVPIDPASRVDFGKTESLIPAITPGTPEATSEAATQPEAQQTAFFMDEAYEPEFPGSCGSQPVFSNPTGWMLPLATGSYVVRQSFSSDHSGIDLEALSGTDVLAARAGVVIFAGRNNNGQGNMVVLAHGDSYSLYGHLRSVLATCGAFIPAGQVIGTVGATGNTSGPHLHFEMLDKDRQPIDPADLIDF